MHIFYEIKNFTDKNGKMVIKMEPQTGKSAEYYGSATIVTEDKKRIPIQFPFPSEIKTVAACFENFDSTIKSFIEEKSKQNVPQTSPSSESESSAKEEGGKILQFKRPE